ncbi:putative eukaryotic initiation factor-3 subunit 10 [Cardiosporidium cionae]|uniref:Eukaryotic initiation factor-3 subunit 10 n=1 Tax=Cardiosporidium cionae TaxID=476202 RepID=A0ABQ7J4G5_9APIC|nr:putative eukaryotic initiation factor-3 subunit 10 [Cardiosporidium cionae]|eukprot:KAF8817969.1 putative eukaryotic initiation factor-3 subunit 10 [Cardiosporidium cionae]
MQIFWVSDNFLFHALAWIKYLLHVKNFKKNVEAADLEGLCNTAVLAVLSIPTNLGGKRHDELDIDSVSTLENQKKMTTLLGHPTIPSRDILKYALSHRDILSRSSDVCQKLYALLETEFTPLKLCSECQPLLKQLENTSNAKYVTPLKRIIFHKLIVQLSRVFTSVTIEYFTTQICPNDFYEWDDVCIILF